MNASLLLRDCPSSPNCVCTLASRASQQMPPVQFSGDPELALSQVRELLSSLPRVKIVEEKNDYLHATFTTTWLRFVDDVEFAIDREANELHFRSASRLGYSDLGANRKRMERVVVELSKLPSFS